MSPATISILPRDRRHETTEYGLPFLLPGYLVTANGGTASSLVPPFFYASTLLSAFVFGRSHDDVGGDGVHLRQDPQNFGVEMLVVSDVDTFDA